MRRRTFFAAAGLGVIPQPTRADAYPSRPIRIIVPFAPGGSGDISARLVGRHIESATGQGVVIDNRPGANGIIGTMAVKTAPADGYTMGIITTSTHAANSSLMRSLPYDPEKDFTIIGFFRSSGTYLLVRPEAPYQSFDAFLAAARSSPGSMFFGYFNSSSRTPPEYLSRLAGIDMQGVPYRAIGNAVSDLISGRIHFLFIDTTASDAFIRNGQLRPIAITRPTRSSQFPEVPAVAETFPGFNITGFLGLSISSATRPEIAEKANALVNDAMRAAEVRGRMEEYGLTAASMTIAAATEEVRIERERWAHYVKVAGIPPE
jgi:tripartite-type tricarboxylate transporter receptor subunit TctC